MTPQRDTTTNWHFRPNFTYEQQTMSTQPSNEQDLVSNVYSNDYFRQPSVTMMGYHHHQQPGGYILPRATVGNIDSHVFQRSQWQQSNGGGNGSAAATTTPTKRRHGNWQVLSPSAPRFSPQASARYVDYQQQVRGGGSDVSDQIYNNCLPLPFALNTTMSGDVFPSDVSAAAVSCSGQQLDLTGGGGGSYLQMTQDSINQIAGYVNYQESMMNAAAAGGGYGGAPPRYVSPHGHPYDKWGQQVFRKTPGASRPVSRLGSYGGASAGTGTSTGGGGGVAHGGHSSRRSPPTPTCPAGDPVRKLFQPPRGHTLHTVLSASDLCGAESGVTGGGGGTEDASGPQELMVSNLDYNISAREWKKILFTEFQQHIQVRGWVHVQNIQKCGRVLVQNILVRGRVPVQNIAVCGRVLVQN